MLLYRYSVDELREILLRWDLRRLGILNLIYAGPE